MLKSICSSKLYIASSRKDKIHAAILAPSNLSLVQQLAADLDEEFQVPENIGTEAGPEVSDNTSDGYDDLIVDEEINPETDLMTVNDLSSGASSDSHSPSSSPSPAKSEHDEMPKEDRPEADTSELIPESPANEAPQKEEKPAEASTNIRSTTIVKPEQLVNMDVLKGSLNGRADLAGVTRVALKEKEQEIWIYYNDNTNLNNILADIIEYVLNGNFGPLEFNRLARSDNAVVFSISFQSSRELKPIEAVEGETK